LSNEAIAVHEIYYPAALCNLTRGCIEMESNKLLPPPEVSIAVIDETPLAARPSAIPGFLVTYGLCYGAAAWQRPGWAPFPRALLAALWFIFLQAAYTLHSAGHIRSARRVNAPMNKLILAWGFQSNVYLNSEATPRQHVGRAIGGPIASTVATVSAFPFYSLLRHVPLIGLCFEAWFFSNAIMLGVSLIPTPHFDGASLLKWSVAGKTGEEALGDEAVQTAGSLTIGVLFLAALVLLFRGNWRGSVVAFGSAVAALVDLFILKGDLPGS
jgi:Zn-dependent protease